jgi:DNA-binding IclR family transcriptional regulator
MESDNGGSVKSAVRVLDLLDLLGRWDSEMTHSEIAETLAIPKSSLTQILKTLLRRRYLAYLPATRGYQLGPAIAELAQRSSQYRDVVAMAPPILKALTEETQETSALNILKGDLSEVAAVAMSPRRLHYLMQSGDTAPLYATSGGKALLAYLPEDMRADYLANVTFEPFTPNTIRSAAFLRTELDQVVATGFAFVFEEYTPGIVGIAAPILSRTGFPLASVNVALPALRYDDEIGVDIRRALSKAAARFASEIHPNRTAPRRQERAQKPSKDLGTRTRRKGG